MSDVEFFNLFSLIVPLQVRERQETREAKPGLSDDDKIRLQLYVDVHFLLKKLQEIGAIDKVTQNFILRVFYHVLNGYFSHNSCSMPSKAMMFYHYSFQDAKTQESIANVVDVAVANFIKDVQNL